MLAVPADTPNTTPVVTTTFATDGVDEDHEPPVIASASVVVAVGHTVAVPVMVPALGNGSTVTVVKMKAVPQLLVTE